MKAGSSRSALALAAGVTSVTVAILSAASFRSQEIPRTWEQNAVETFELPLATPERSPEHVSEEYYYSLPERVIWRSYPIYHPDREPPGYRDSLALLEPEIAFDPATLVDDEDWVSAGALVFRAPISFDGPTVRSEHVLDADWYAENELGVTRDGIFPWAQWVIRERGKLEVANLGCAMCHTRLMPDGTVIEGAQGNFPLDRVIGRRIRNGGVPAAMVANFSRILVGTPWVESVDRVTGLTLEEQAAARLAVPPGVLIRQGTSFDAPARIPDLIGIRERAYLDASGLVLHRDAGDLMRYAAVNQSMDILASFGGWVPETGTSERPPPGAGRSIGTADRYSDAQLWALARYLYSLEPPPNPHPSDELARRGRAVFEEQGCPLCHTPPLYTNNKLVPATGFDPPMDHLERYAISDLRVGTDPALAMMTRRGTGYYKVPSLKGVWYRGPFQHSGAVATLEDWFDIARLADDYVPTGFMSANRNTQPVIGHPFGLGLSDRDKRALIAFLRTL